MRTVTVSEYIRGSRPINHRLQHGVAHSLNRDGKLLAVMIPAGVWENIPASVRGIVVAECDHGMELYAEREGEGANSRRRAGEDSGPMT